MKQLSRVLLTLFLALSFTTNFGSASSYGQVQNNIQLDDLAGTFFVEGRNSDGSLYSCLLYTSPSPRDKRQSRMPSSA